LDAMAMGRCVIAHDSPTMNEYIQHKENGLLYAWEDITDIDRGVNISFTSDEIRNMQQNAYMTIQQGYAKWEQEQEQIVDWCTQETQPNIVRLHELTDKEEKERMDKIVSDATSSTSHFSYLPEFLFTGKCLIRGSFKVLFYFLLIQFNSRFNRKWYLHQYQDVREKAMAPAAHYLLYGWREGRDPSPRFSTHRYLLCNPDIRRYNICPLVHWKLKGKKEKRSL